MLFISERSWKHHFVTLLLPYAYLMARFMAPKVALWARIAVALAMWLSVFLMGTTSTELGGVFAHGQGHKYAQAYGMFLAAGLAVYAATAWQVSTARREDAGATPGGAIIPAPHFAGAATGTPVS
jgi:hypothetical protein